MTTKQTAYIVDTWAWIAYLDGSQQGERVRPIIENEKTTVYTSAVSLAEIISVFCRRGQHHEPHAENVRLVSTIIPASAESAEKAGVLHADIKRRIKDFGLADAFVLAAARLTGAKILTGDPHFRGFPETVFVE